MHLIAGLRRATLAKLMEIEGYDTIKQLADTDLYGSVSPAIFMNDGSNHTGEMEPDQDADCCEKCRTNSMHAELVLAGFI